MSSMQFAADAAGTPISILRQMAKAIHRTEDIPVSRALDRIAQDAIGAGWSVLMNSSWSLEQGWESENGYVARHLLQKGRNGQTAIFGDFPVRRERPVGVGHFVLPVPDRASVVRKYARLKGVETECFVFGTDSNDPAAIPFSPELYRKMQAADTLQASCSAWISAFDELRDKIPEHHVTFDVETAIEKGLIRHGRQDEDLHETGLRLQRFSGADGRISWRVSFRTAGQDMMHPDLYIPAGQIFGWTDPAALASAIVATVRTDKLVQLSKNGFYMPKQAAVPFVLHLEGKPVLALLGVHYEDDIRSFEYGSQARNIRDALVVLRATISDDRLHVEDAGHLGRDIEGKGDDLEIWQWGLNGVVRSNRQMDAISLRGSRRPNARMRHLDHHVIRGLVDLVARSMKAPSGQGNEDLIDLNNAIWVWSSAENTNGSFAQEPFKRGTVYYATERREKNRNPRAVFLTSAAAALFDACYIDLPLTREVREKIGRLVAYYEKLARRQSAILDMTSEV